MELTELYNQIQNPIEDSKVIEKLINAYANSSGTGEFYDQLAQTVEKEHTEGRYYKVDADRFYSMMFNKWKNSILALTREQVIELLVNRSYERDFLKIIQFLKKIPDVKTKQEAEDIFFGKYNDKELEGALDKYRWTAFGEKGDWWVHVCSRYVTAKQDKYPNIEHRLYLNTESLDTYKMITYLVEKCDEHHLPYYFKFDQRGSRDDTIVIYSSTENLTKYVEILQEIKKEHPDLVARAKEPPLLTGKIDGWIGYGSEPSRTADGEKTSFNEIRSNVIEPTIDKTMKKWIMDHKNMQIIYQGQKLSLQDYTAMKATERMIEKLENLYIRNANSDKQMAQKTGKKYNENDTVAKMGYTLQDIKSPSFKDNVYKILRAKMGTCIQSFCNGTCMTAIQMDVRNGRQICLYAHDLKKTIKGLSVDISKIDPNFIKDVHSAIISNARQYGIDADKFCFDIKARERMRLVEAQMQSNQQNQTTIQEPTKPVQQPQQGETIKKEPNIDLSNLNVQTLPEIISQELMERKIKLSNGDEISARKYIQEIVYPHLPKNGIVILVDGTLLPVRQFIEERVMFECQEKYNGDFPRYMAERTRNNIGVISIQSNDGLHQINPVEIIKYINPALLGMRMKLPNGIEISARQYIQEVYAPHIPANGRVILSNGNEISVKQYIEEVLLFEGQSKYNGDINQILYNTTKRNTGIVTADPQKNQETLLQFKNQTTDYTNQPTEFSDVKRK